MALPDSGKINFNYYGEEIEGTFEITRAPGGASPDIIIKDHTGRLFEWSLTDAELDTMTVEELSQGLSDKYREKVKGAEI